MPKTMRMGKGYELTVAGLLLGADFDIYLPTVDDQGIDAIIRCPLKDGLFKYHEVQIKGSQTWSGIRCKTGSLFTNSILLLYCAKERRLLWLLFDDVQKHFPRHAAIHGDSWGNVFLRKAIVDELTQAGHTDIEKLKQILMKQ